MFLSHHHDAMQRAIMLAHRGPAVDPNPQVGCVIIDDGGSIIAEGWHRGRGTLHAEADALTQIEHLSAKQCAQLTMVVTLEPCNHTGTTGPCAQAIIASGIPRVIYGSSDPGDASAGGATTLVEAGVQVHGGFHKSATDNIIEPWLQWAGYLTNTGRVILKWAQTLDARLAAADGSSQWITSAEARAHVHQLRAQCKIIVTGTGTVLEDNPALTARDATGNLLGTPAEQPLPVVLGTRGISENSALLDHPALASQGYEKPPQFSGHDLVADMAKIRELAPGGDILVEAGPTLNNALLRSGVADEIAVYIAPTLLGGPRLAVDNLGIQNLEYRQDLIIIDQQTLGPDMFIRARFTEQETQ